MKFPTKEISAAGTWSILDTSSTWMREFTSALTQNAPTVGWMPRFSWFGLLQRRYEPKKVVDPPLNAIQFPLQRGYSRAPLRWLNPLSGLVATKMINHFFRPGKLPARLYCSILCALSGKMAWTSDLLFD